jgi:hypothetical protein
MDPSPAALTGSWACDDDCPLYLNGVAIPAATSGAQNYEAFSTFTIPAGSPYRVGDNTLEIVVDNTGPGPMGLQIRAISDSSTGGACIAAGGAYDAATGACTATDTDTMGSLLTPQQITGAWYDPAYAGSGFNMTMTPAGLLIYYYGWDKDGNRLWLSSELGPTEVVGGTPVMLNMVETNGGTFLDPAKPETQSIWGTVTVDFAADGTTATAILTGNDGDVTLDLESLAGMTSDASVTGAWYDRAADGSGFNLLMTDTGLLVYYYGWDKDGNRLWLSAGIDPAEIGPGASITMNLVETNGGSFLTPANPDTQSDWGTLQLDFSSCTQATATLTGNDGTVDLGNLVMLVGVLDMPPGC